MPNRCVERTTSIVAIAVLLALSMSNEVAGATAQSAFDLSATKVTIFAPGGGPAIGEGYYKLSRVGGVDVVEGANKYLNGEYDREEQTIKPSVEEMPPVLINFKHEFFNPDGSLQYSDSLDVRTGHAVCKRFDSSLPDIRESTLKVPADTYAGATQLMLVIGRLRLGATNIRFHSFNCLPDPRIIAIKATPLSGPVSWSMYPGNLLQMEMTPDFGWLNILLAPFIPRIYGWFAPTDGFEFVGGQFDRYYRGRHILLVRRRE